MQLVVGRIARPHGVRGEVVVDVHTDDPGIRFTVGSVLTTDPPQAGPLTVDAVRWHSGRLLIVFAGIADRTQADDLRGVWLTLDSAQAGEPEDPDEFNDHDLIGLAVVTTAGEPVGQVTDVRHHGQDLLVIGSDGLLVPFVRDIVPEIDLPARRMVIDPPPGLLELGSEGPASQGR
ncbi:MAG TPA: ribosome maturation factor RimM [Streptosporangiaceae bacterium]|jgi:16S rRNA processing protein RimM|nr:ribosome maturation factor RimM [Streptosporangiaceae bacterium]